jgi:hypothetical protein
MKLLTTDIDELIEILSQKELVILIDKIDLIIENDKKNFIEFLDTIFEKTENVKIILVTDQDISNEVNLFDSYVTVLKIAHLEKKYAAKMLL